MLGLNPLSFIYKDLPDNVDWADVVHVHSYIYFLGNQVALYRKKRRFPFILHLHGGTSPITSEVYGVRAAIAKKIYDRTIGKWEIDVADYIMSSSKNDVENAINIFGANPNRITHPVRQKRQFYLEVVTQPRRYLLVRRAYCFHHFLIPKISRQHCWVIY